MKKTIFIYGGILAAGTILLKSIEHFYVVRILPTPIYIALLAVLFTCLGVWVGQKITSKYSQKEEKPPFKRNDQAIKSLGISERELEVLEHLAKGQSNQEISDTLFISVNTVKTHLSSLYQKLGVSRRSMAVKKARTLKLIP